MPTAEELEAIGRKEIQEAESGLEASYEEPEEEGEEEEHPEDAQHTVDSTMVAEWGYDRGNQTLTVVFVNNNEASYQVSPEAWEEAQNAPSIGRWMHENVL